ncbi:uncharacterized protein LOC143281500 [Babylonia areolata]|uniref:uncharacterized protein LOC143281500 n=1 Tax=Babylonia areolata TaxID=304850 RepID=UPI003FD353A3
MSRAAVHSQSYQSHQGTYPATTMKQQGAGGRQAERVGEERPSRLMQMKDDYQRRLLKEKEEKMVSMYEDHQRRNQERAERVTRGGGGGGGGNNTNTTSNNNLREFFRERREMEARGGYVPPIDQHYKQSKSRTSSSHSFHKTSAGVDRSQPLAPIHPANRATQSHASSPFNNRPRLVKHANNSRKGGSSFALASQGGEEETISEKMSDFRKWQMEQSKAREDRLKKASKRAPQRPDDDGDDDEYREGRRGGGGGEGRSKEEEEALMGKIARQQAELDRMKRAREEEEEAEVKRETEKEIAERERRRRQQQQQEETRRRREEAAQAKRGDKEQHQRKPTTRPSRDEDTVHTQRTATTTNNSNNNRRSVQQQPTPRQPPSARDSSPTSRNPPRTQRRQPPPQRRPRSAEEDDDEVPGPGNEIYAQAVEGEQGGKVRLVPCKVCGRKFADDRVQKHQVACKKVQKKRKVMDPTKMRTEGTDMAKYVSKGAHKQEPPKKKADWRRQHEEFIANIRYAKQLQQMEQQGLSSSDLPPPPPASHNPDLVPCPHCGRTFNEQAAERHIPRCQQLKTRPAGNKRR